jgi:hypothetical protein
MKQISLLATLILIGGILTSCCTAKKAENAQPITGAGIPGPKVIIYKTTKDYSKLVPVTLGDDKKSIASYPDIKDIYFDGLLAYPTQLNDGFLLDNRGISANVAFINLTYEEYSKLPATPSPDELMKIIIDKQPLSVMYNCGPRSAFKQMETELNAKIDAKDFSAFTRIK